MNKFLIMIMAGLMLAACNSETGNNSTMTINGSIEGDYAGQVILFNRVAGEWVKLDSAQAENGNFTLTAEIEMPEMLYVSIEGNNNFAPVFAEPSEITFNANIADFKNAEVSGSAAHDEYMAFRDKMNMFDEMYIKTFQKIKDAREAGDSAAEQEADQEYQSIEEQQMQFMIDNAMTNNNSAVAAWSIDRNSYQFDVDDLEPIVSNFDPSISKSVYVQKLDERVKTLKRVAVGQPAVDFTMTDIEGNPLSLSELYGNYLLVDFWASWCGPCRRENPNVVAAYEKFHDKGFDILGVSFDRKKEDWIKAVEADNLTWHHVSDLQYWDNKAGQLYGIKSIPANVLLDPEGIIIAKNLREEDLHNKLEELLN